MTCAACCPDSFVVNSCLRAMMHCAVAEWNAARNSASSLLPKHAAVAGWKHRALSFMEHEGKDRHQNTEEQNTEMLMVFWCSLPLGVVAAEARLHVAGQQLAGIVPWVGAMSNEEMQRLQDKCQCNMLLLQNFQLVGPDRLTGADGSLSSCSFLKLR